MYPYQPQPYPMMQNQPTFSNSQQIIKVNGEASANSYNMMPNSSALMLDENQPLVYLAVTDSAGYKTITKYKLEPYKAPEPINIEDIQQRLTRLEEKYEQSHTRHDSKTECNQSGIKKS